MVAIFMFVGAGAIIGHFLTKLFSDQDTIIERNTWLEDEIAEINTEVEKMKEVHNENRELWETYYLLWKCDSATRISEVPCHSWERVINEED